MMPHAAIAEPRSKRPVRESLFFCAALALVYLGFVAWTSLDWVKSPRFLAEEGNLFFENIRLLGIRDSIFFLHSSGYYQLPNNLIAMIGVRLPIEFWPTTTQLASVLIQAAVVVSPFWVRGAPIGTAWQRAVLSVGFMLVLPNSETWLNSTCIQFLFAIPLALMMLDDRHAIAIAERCALGAYALLAALSGPPACIFAPMFWLAFAISRTRHLLTVATILTIAAVAQALLMAKFGVIASPEMGSWADWLTGARHWPNAALVNSFVLPVLGERAVAAVNRTLAAFPSSWIGGCTILLGCVILAVSAACRSLPGRITALLTVAFCGYSFASLVANGIDPRQLLADQVIGARYTIVTSHLTLILAHVWFVAAAGIAATSLGAALSIAIAVSGATYAFIGRKQDEAAPWAAEVAAWRRGERPCGLRYAGAGGTWTLLMDRNATRAYIAVALHERGHLAPEAVPGTPNFYDAVSEGIREFKRREFGRKNANDILGPRVIAALCGPIYRKPR
ncbi:MAG: hypothetical protein EXQ92_00135 [Alphaproteobacteria bacterium]|nr:hypothetical protein [Alphaproteobacteria bacterium]